jgi:hypothetical protein
LKVLNLKETEHLQNIYYVQEGTRVVNKYKYHW